MKESLIEYIKYTKEYGKPSDEAIDYFINSELGSEIIQSPSSLNDKNIEFLVNSNWIDVVKTSDISEVNFSGGYNFYNYLSEQSIIDEKSLKTAIENYKQPSIPSINDNLKQTFQNADEVYKVRQPDNTFHYICISNNQTKLYNNYGSLLSTIQAVDNKLQTITSNQIYLGVELNVFINEPINNIGEFALYSIYLNLLQPSNNQNGLSIVQTSLHSTTSIVSGESVEAEQAEKSYNSFSSDQASIAEKSIEADRLSDEGVQQVTDEFIKKILNERQDVIDEIELRIEKHREEIEEQRKWKYTPIANNCNFQTKDIYENEVIERARDILNESHRLLIIGNTGDGKSELARLLAYELTGETIDLPGEYNYICETSARNADSLVGEGLKQYGLLDRFIKHIENNKIEKPCVLICNEVQASDMGYILGEKLWESWSNKSDNKVNLPDNLYLIFTGCIDKDFGIEGQTTGRIDSVEINYLSSKAKTKHQKIVNEFGQDFENILDKIEEINDNEDCQVISFRDFKGLLNGKKLNITNVDILKPESKGLLEKLEEI